MTPTKSGKVGHVRRGGDNSPSFCGLSLRGGYFTDPAVTPRVCKRCAAGYEKQSHSDHHHLIFQAGTWRITAPGRRFTDLSGNLGSFNFNVTRISSACGIEGCVRMVAHEVFATAGSTGSTTTVHRDWWFAA